MEAITEPARIDRPEVALMRFNRRPVIQTGAIEQPTDELVKNTSGLWNASAEDALRYGGDLTRAALGAMDLRNDRRYVVVDVKVHMLKPGMWPAIPGWHTDGVPRGGSMSPANGLPNIWKQEGVATPPRYHLLVTGTGCLTQFIRESSLMVRVPTAPTADLYASVTREVNAMIGEGRATPYAVPSCTVAEWDWWDLHRGVAATASEWRYLIRVTETDYLPPQTDLRAVLRTQSQVYVPSEAFGW